MTRDGDVRIADLGLALFVESVEVTVTQTHKGGTPGERAHSSATTLYSLSTLSALLIYLQVIERPKLHPGGTQPRPTFTRSPSRSTRW